jgi:hypothetical protein
MKTPASLVMPVFGLVDAEIAATNCSVSICWRGWNWCLLYLRSLEKVQKEKVRPLSWRSARTNDAAAMSDCLLCCVLNQWINVRRCFSSSWNSDKDFFYRSSGTAACLCRPSTLVVPVVVTSSLFLPTHQHHQHPNHFMTSFQLVQILQ